MPYVSGGGSSSGAISGVTVTGTAAASDVIVASSASAGTWQLPSGFIFGYDQITGQVNVASATESSGTTIISCAAHTFDGAPVYAHFSAPFIGAANNDSMNVCLFEASTEIGRLCTVSSQNASGGSATPPGQGWLRFTPTAASHTYTVTAFHGTSGGFVGAGAGGTGVVVPAFIRFIKE